MEGQVYLVTLESNGILTTKKVFQTLWKEGGWKSLREDQKTHFECIAVKILNGELIYLKFKFKFEFKI